MLTWKFDNKKEWLYNYQTYSWDIEKIQKTAFKIILGDNYLNYDVACTLFGVEPLDFRRIELCLNFAKKDMKQDNSIFIKNLDIGRTRRKPDVVKNIKCRTKRFEKSSLPYLSRLLNNVDWTFSGVPHWKCDLLDHGCKVQLMVLIPCWYHKFAVLYFLPLVLLTAINKYK